MSIGIPIISTFEDKGIKAAIQEFKQLETNTEKLGAAATAGAKIAGAAFLALAAGASAAGVVLLGAAKAAAEDEASQRELASQIAATTDASAIQIKGVEEFIDKTQRASGIADDKLRPALGRLTAATGDVTKAQDLMNIGLDLSAATGKDVEIVALALAKAQEGNFGALEKLGVGYEKGEIKARGFEAVQKDLEERFAGAALEKANTYEGVMARLKITFDEIKESVGYKILPAMTDLGNSALRISDAFGKDGAAGGVAQLRQEIVNLGTDASGLQNTFGSIYDSVAKFVNGVMNALAIPLGAIHFLRTGDFGSYSPPNMPTWADLVKSTGGAGTTYAVTSRQAEAMFGMGTNTVTTGTGASNLGAIPKKAAAPPKGPFEEGYGGGFAEAGLGGIGNLFAPGQAGININIDAGMISSPISIGQDIIDAILAAQRANGTVFAPA